MSYMSLCDVDEDGGGGGAGRPLFCIDRPHLRAHEQDSIVGARFS